MNWPLIINITLVLLSLPTIALGLLCVLACIEVRGNRAGRPGRGGQ